MDELLKKLESFDFFFELLYVSYSFLEKLFRFPVGIGGKSMLVPVLLFVDPLLVTLLVVLIDIDVFNVGMDWWRVRVIKGLSEDEPVVAVGVLLLFVLEDGNSLMVLIGCT